MYAIIRDRGMQYRVEEGQELDIALIEADPGSEVELSEVLLIGGADDTKVGAPYVDGARVIAEIKGVATGDKLIVFKYKNKKRYRRRTGHRQDYTRIVIRKIEGTPA